jgi:hypothetical protein
MKGPSKRKRNSAVRSPEKQAGVKGAYQSVVSTEAWKVSFARRLKAIAAVAILSMVIAPRSANSESASPEDQVRFELAAMGKYGAVVARVREQTLEVLQGENGCSTWFREADPDAAEVFRSLHYELDERGPFYAFHTIDSQGGDLFKHPWAARSTEYGGRDALVILNPNGPFFTATALVRETHTSAAFRRAAGGSLILVVGSYSGNTRGAQITTMLHELGHIVGRIPEDGDTWDGRSGRNTEEVLRHCKRDIRAVIEKGSRGGP